MGTMTEERAPETVSSTRLVRRPNAARDREAFARRLNSAADGHPHCPPLHHGRLTWLRDELQKRMKMDVTVESVRKWLAGETKPHQDKILALAEILRVTPGFLAIGEEGTPREQKARGKLVDGAVNIVAGLIQMDGGSVAFPEKDGPVDLHAIIKAGHYSFNVAAQDATGKFQVPLDYEELIVLGVVKKGFSFRLFEITGDTIAENGKRKGSTIDVEVDVETLREITSFEQRI